MNAQGWRQKAEPAPVEQKCLDCPRTFQRSAYAVKRVRCDQCRKARAKALAGDSNARWREAYKKSPPPSWRRYRRHYLLTHNLLDTQKTEA